MKVVLTHTAPEGRADLRQNATQALTDAKEVTSMLVCGQILTLLDDIETLIEALTHAGVEVKWASEDTMEERLGSNLKPMDATVNWTKGG